MARDPLLVVRIPPAMLASVDDACTRAGATRSAFVRDALNAHLPPATPPPTQKRTTSTPTRQTQPGTHQDACTHRVHPGAYCKRCERMI